LHFTTGCKALRLGLKYQVAFAVGAIKKSRLKRHGIGFPRLCSSNFYCAFGKYQVAFHPGLQSSEAGLEKHCKNLPKALLKKGRLKMRANAHGASQ
jgi:hypothetical protein